MSSFRRELKRLLSETKTSQAELSRATGIPTSAISSYVTGKYEAKNDNRKKIYEYFSQIAVLKDFTDEADIFPVIDKVRIEIYEISDLIDNLEIKLAKDRLNSLADMLDEVY